MFKFLVGISVLVTQLSCAHEVDADELLQEPSLPFYDDYLFLALHEQNLNIVDKAFPKMSAKWDSHRISVCWKAEAMDSIYETDRETVRKAIADSWERESALEFYGWELCPTNAIGIRISLIDASPQTKGLGKELEEPGSEGMFLNFRYQLWNTNCNRTDQAHQECNRVYAVHEFGHAIGFAHEQNRRDASDDCNEEDLKQGALGTAIPVDSKPLTPWDQDSVMNYCTVPLLTLNNGKLSDFDIMAVRTLYGKPST